ncbi:class I SAM-dependent methyltransferase [Achromobacter aegrifaciens]
MDQKSYSDFWERESSQLQKDEIYARLSEISPIGPTLEVGCGAGWSTASLASNRPVLAIDNNPHLIGLAGTRLKSLGLDVQFIQTDVFEPSAASLAAIDSFQPKIVAGWLIGSHPDDNDKRTPSELTPEQKPKKYRENVEDRLVGGPLCPPSVEWVHLAFRGAIPAGYTPAQVAAGTKDDYDTYVFRNAGFTVTDVQVLEWNKGASEFPYVQAPNPNLPSGATSPAIVSVLARRTSAL